MIFMSIKVIKRNFEKRVASAVKEDQRKGHVCETFLHRKQLNVLLLI